jgi:transcriptional regulator CtsR
MNSINTMDTEIKSIEEYLKSLNEQERKTLEIAKDHLGTSFNIKKSIGYITWKTKKNN